MLVIYPLTIKKANDVVSILHRTHRPVVGGLFAVGCAVRLYRPSSRRTELQCVGAAIAGRPSARRLDDGHAVEVLRVSTDGTKNACSKLLGAMARAAKELGYARIYTYTMAEEPGTSLVGAGWELDATTKGGSWSRAGRSRSEPLHVIGPKNRWVKTLRKNYGIAGRNAVPTLPRQERNDRQRELFLD